MSERKLIIVGGAAAGNTAALYAARGNLKPLVIEGVEAGGQLMLTTDVENYPGFVDGIMGPDLMTTFRKQAERFGSEFIGDDVTEVDFSVRPFKVSVSDQQFTAQAVIVATGANAKMLGLENEQKLLGRGVSTCATCDGAFFRDQAIAVVGGGDSAMEEALFLTRFATKVTVVHRRDELRASKIMAERALANEKIEFVWDSAVEDVHGDGRVEALSLRNLKTDETSRLDVGAMFVAIGHTPNSQLFTDHLELDEAGYIKTGDSLVSDPLPGAAFETRTSVEGVFAAGDVVDHTYRQAVTAAGTGCMAAIDAERWLEQQGL